MMASRTAPSLGLILVLSLAYLAIISPTTQAAPSVYEQPIHTLEGSFDPKRSGSRGFHEGIFDHGFGGFSTVKKRGKRNSGANFVAKRIPEMTSRGIGIDGDAFTGGFGNFYTMKRSAKTVPVLTTLYNNFMEDYLDILEKMEKLEELKFNERKLSTP